MTLNRFKLIIVVLLFLILFSTLKFEVVVPGDGVIVGGDGDVDIVTPDSGFINLVNVKEGGTIEKGEVIFSYNNLEVHYREKSLINLVTYLESKKSHIENEIINLKKIYQYSEDDFKHGKKVVDENYGTNAIRYFRELKSVARKLNELTNTKNLNTAERKEIKFQKKILLDKVNLLKKSNSPRVEILENQKEIAQLSTSVIRLDSDLLKSNLDIQNEIDNFQINLLEKIDFLAEEILKIKRELIESNDSLLFTLGKQKANVIVSPVTGTVMSMEKQFTVGSYIESSQKVMTIKQTQSSSLISANVSAKYRPFISNGDLVKIAVNSPGYKHALEGEIISIGVDSLKHEDNPSLTERFYEIEIDPISINSFENEMIGVQVNVYIVSDMISVFEYISATIVDNVRFNVW